MGTCLHSPFAHFAWYGTEVHVVIQKHDIVVALVRPVSCWILLLPVFHAFGTTLRSLTFRPITGRAVMLKSLGTVLRGFELSDNYFRIVRVA